MPNYLSVYVLVPSGLLINNCRQLLKNHNVTELLGFLEFGLPSDFTGTISPISGSKNHADTAEYQKWIDRFINTEITHNALLGLFTEPPFQSWAQMSPIMTRPKKNTDKCHIIVGLSYPKGNSVNSGKHEGSIMENHSIYPA